MKEKILKLRLEGKTYDEIKKELGCSKSTISYHCGEGQKEKTHKRSKKYRKSVKGILCNKLHDFLIRKSRDFRNSTKGSERRVTTHKFTVGDILNKFGEAPKCYLTGDNINLYDPGSYQFDHIVPVCKGGDNSLDNLGLVIKDANLSKFHMTVEEYVELCKKVINNFERINT